MRKSRLLTAVLAVLSLLLAGVSSCKPGSSQQVELTIFHTNDIHSQLRAPKSDEYHLGGLARMATLFSSLRATRKNSVTLDAGDWSEGAWAFSIDTGANMLRFLADMQFDATVVGNHDYLVGPDRLVDTVEEAHPAYPVLAANLDLSKYAGAERLRKLIGSTAIIEKGGLKIGVIGLTCVDYEFSHFLNPVIASDIFKAASAAAEELRPKVDVLVILSHNKFELNMELARVTAGVDAVVSGHSHRKIATAVLVKNNGKDVPVVETGCWGRFIGDLRLAVDTAAHTVKYKAYEIHPIEPTLAEDPSIRTKVDAEYAKLDKLYGSDVTQVVTHTDAFLEDKDIHTAGLGHLASKAYRAATSSDTALEMLPFAGFPITPGPVTIESLHDVLPHTMDMKTGKEWTIKVWNARAADLGLILNLFYSGVNSLPFGSSGYIVGDNLDIVWEPKGVNGPVAKIKSIAINGVPLDMSKRYTVALTDGVLLSFQIANDLFHIGMDMSQVFDSGIEGWRSIVDYGKSLQVITADGLLENAKTTPTTADLGLDRTHLTYRAGKLVAQIQNHGLAASPGGKLKCSVGTVNRPQLYNTDDEVFVPAVEGIIPALDPGKEVVLELPWNPTNGAWPVRCDIVAEHDGYAGNNSVMTVFQVGNLK